MPSMLICQCPKCKINFPVTFPGSPLKHMSVDCELCGERFNAWDNAKERNEKDD